MCERPIIFSTDEVNAILGGRKTQTRRLNGLHKINEKPDYWELVGTGITGYTTFQNKVQMPFPQSDSIGVYCPYTEGKWHGHLWVRETWQETTWMHPNDENYGYIYKASENGKTWEENSEGWTWRSPIYMPRFASRITLEITNIRVERLQNIAEEDAKAEGVAYSEESQDYDDYSYNNKNWDAYGVPTAKQSFATLWDKINGKRASWDGNPWVWVVEFRKL